jgi:hypothetical protein
VGKINQALLIKCSLSFARAFVGVLVVSAVSLDSAANAGNWSLFKSLAVAAVVGGVTAGIRAVQHVVFDTP